MKKVMALCPECDSPTIPLKKGEHVCSQCDTRIRVTDDASLLLVNYQKPTKEYLEKASEYWRSGRNPETDSSQIEKDLQEVLDYLLGDSFKLNEAQTPKKPGVLYCTFCNREVGEFEATFGKVPKVFRKDEILSDEPLTIHTKYVHSAKRLVACPEHALQIKPQHTVHKSYRE